MIPATIRTARKAHSCGRCRGLIRPGERYRAAAIPPRSDIGNEGWWHEKECGSCAESCGRPITTLTLETRRKDAEE